MRFVRPHTRPPTTSSKAQCEAKCVLSPRSSEGPGNRASSPGRSRENRRGQFRRATWREGGTSASLGGLALPTGVTFASRARRLLATPRTRRGRAGREAKGYELRGSATSTRTGSTSARATTSRGRAGSHQNRADRPLTPAALALDQSTVRPAQDHWHRCRLPESSYANRHFPDKGTPVVRRVRKATGLLVGVSRVTEGRLGSLPPETPEVASCAPSFPAGAAGVALPLSYSPHARLVPRRLSPVPQLRVTAATRCRRG
jgi:hypothetical protein